MSWRRQLAVASPISIRAVVRAGVASAFGGHVRRAAAPSLIGQRFGASAVIPTDTGTSALVLALRLAVPPGGVVAYPAFACVDLAAAALFAGVRVRLYDIDPDTLSPDLDSVARVLSRGVDALVVAHLFGYPVDVPRVRALTEKAGVPLIEDAAQGAGGVLKGRLLGGFGDLSVLSFGRGKGLCAGGGGALLGFGARWKDALAAVNPRQSGRGWAGLAAAAVQWGLGRPGLYALPSMVPWLRLGEMVYHPAHEPAGISLGSSCLLRSAFDLLPNALATRRRNATALFAATGEAPGLAAATPIEGAEPGYLRFPVRDVGGRRQPAARLGILRSYPQTLAEQPHLAPALVPGEPTTPGATELRRSLFTVPTHALTSSRDLADTMAWMAGGDPRP